MDYEKENQKCDRRRYKTLQDLLSNSEATKLPVWWPRAKTKNFYFYPTVGTAVNPSATIQGIKFLYLTIHSQYHGLWSVGYNWPILAHTDVQTKVHGNPVSL